MQLTREGPQVALRTTEPTDIRPDRGPDRQSAQQSLQRGQRPGCPATSSAGRLLGLAYTIIMIVRVAHMVHA